MRVQRKSVGGEAQYDEVVTLRLPQALIERLAAHVERMREQQPGVRITRTDAVRSLLTNALNAVDRERDSARG